MFDDLYAKRLGLSQWFQNPRETATQTSSQQLSPETTTLRLPAFLENPAVFWDGSRTILAQWAQAEGPRLARIP